MNSMTMVLQDTEALEQQYATRAHEIQRAELLLSALSSFLELDEESVAAFGGEFDQLEALLDRLAQGISAERQLMRNERQQIAAAREAINGLDKWRRYTTRYWEGGA